MRTLVKSSGCRLLAAACTLLAVLVLASSIPRPARAQTKKEAEKKAQLECKDADHAKKKAMLDKSKGEKLSAKEKIEKSWQLIESREGSAAAAVFAALEKKGPGAGAKMYEKLSAHGGDGFYFKEGEFNTAGYVFLHSDRIKEAIEVFELNVKAHPDSWNVYDSLGEAYMAAGNTEHARKLYTKSLALNPDNDHGREMLAKLAEMEKNGESVASKNE